VLWPIRFALCVLWALASGADSGAGEKGRWGVNCGTDRGGKSERIERRSLDTRPGGLAAKNKTLFPLRLFHQKEGGVITQSVLHRLRPIPLILCGKWLGK